MQYTAQFQVIRRYISSRWTSCSVSSGACNSTFWIGFRFVSIGFMVQDGIHTNTSKHTDDEDVLNPSGIFPTQHVIAWKFSKQIYQCRLETLLLFRNIAPVRYKYKKKFPNRKRISSQNVQYLTACKSTQNNCQRQESHFRSHPQAWTLDRKCPKYR